MTSILKVDNIQTSSGATAKAKDVGLNDAGTILQVKSTLWQTRTQKSYAAATRTAVDELAVTITPRDANSRFMIFARISGEWNGTNHHDTLYGIDRSGTAINEGTHTTTTASGISMAMRSYGGTDNDSTPDTTSFQTVDSPATASAITYKVTVWQAQGYDKFWNGAVNSSASNTSNESTSSEIIVMEIAG